MVALPHRRNATVEVHCRQCKDVFFILVNSNDLHKWRSGTLIQDAMPYLDDGERELLISQTCSTCWHYMFGEVE